MPVRGWAPHRAGQSNLRSLATAVPAAKSAAVLARVRELEARKAAPELQMRMIDKPPRLVPNIESMVVARIEQLEEAARDPDHGDRVRVAAHDLIGSVRVIEEGERMIGEIDGGRLLMLGASPDVTNGAQERT